MIFFSIIYNGLPLCSVLRIHLPIQETWVRSLGQDDPQGEGNGNPLQYSRKSHGQKSLVVYSQWYPKRVGHDIVTKNNNNIQWGFPGGSDGKNPPAMQETWGQFLGWEDPLEEGMATHSNILPWRIPTDKGAWQAAVHGVTKSLT